MQKGQLIRAEQVAEIIGVSPRVAKELMKQMPRVNLSVSTEKPRWAVSEADLQAWIASRTAPGETPERRPRRKRKIIIMPGTLDEHGHIPKRR